MSRGGKNKKKQGQASNSDLEAKQRTEKELKEALFFQIEKGENSRASKGKLDVRDGCKGDTQARSVSPTKDPTTLGSSPSMNDSENLEKGDLKKQASSSMGTSFQTRLGKGEGQIGKASKCAGVGVAPPRPELGGQKLYSQAVKGFRRGAMMDLDFVPATYGDSIEPLDGEIIDAEKGCGVTLIGAVMGDEITMATLTNFMKRSWPFQTPEFLVKDDGIIVMQFSTPEQCGWVLEHGPWSIDPRRPLLLKAWSPAMSTDWSAFKEVVTWVRILDIPPAYCTRYMLSLIGSGIGKPICTDEFTASHKLLSFARLLVEVNVEQTRRKSVKIVHKEGVCELRVIFEWLPKCCTTCSSFGHSDVLCSRMGKMNHAVFGASNEPVGASKESVGASDLPPSVELCETVAKEDRDEVSEGPAENTDSKDEASKEPAVNTELAPPEPPDTVKGAEECVSDLGNEVSKEPAVSDGKTGDKEVVGSLTEEGKEGKVYSGEYAKECVRFIAKVWATDAGMSPNESTDGSEYEAKEDGIKTPIAVLSFVRDDGSMCHNEFVFKQKKTSGPISLDTRVTLSLDEIYEAFDIIKKIDWDEDEEDVEDEKGSEKEVEDDEIKDKTAA